MDAHTLMKEYTCRLCGRLPSVDADIVFAEDGFCYDRKCMMAYIETTSTEDIVISPVTNESIGITLFSPKPIKCLIEKLCVGGSEDSCASQTETHDGISEVEDKDKMSDGDLLARKGYDIYFGCSNNTKNQNLGFELLVEAASVGGSGKCL